MLDWLFLKSRNRAISEEDVRLKFEIEKIVSLLNPGIRLKNITLETHLDDIKLIGDSRMISTVIRNLISNAIKFTNKDGKIVVRLRMSNGMVHISIKDDGIGMSREIIDNLFNDKERPQRFGTENEKGTGLGLLVCNHIVKNMGGFIEVDSSEGNGSLFAVNLPVKPS